MPETEHLQKTLQVIPDGGSIFICNENISLSLTFTCWSSTVKSNQRTGSEGFSAKTTSLPIPSANNTTSGMTIIPIASNVNRAANESIVSDVPVFSLDKESKSTNVFRRWFCFTA